MPTSPVVIRRRAASSSGGSDCDFDKVEPSLAGYAVVAVCRSKAGMNPTRLVIVTPDQPKISILTDLRAVPFRDPSAAASDALRI